MIFPVCYKCDQPHEVWDVDVYPRQQDHWEASASCRHELATARHLIGKINLAPVDTDERLDGVRELGEHILRHLGPDSLTAQNPRWRAVVLNQFTCFRVQLEVTRADSRFSDTARRWFRTVARAVVHEVGRLHV